MVLVVELLQQLFILSVVHKVVAVSATASHRFPCTIASAFSTLRGFFFLFKHHHSHGLTSVELYMYNLLAHNCNCSTFTMCDDNVVGMKRKPSEFLYRSRRSSGDRVDRVDRLEIELVVGLKSCRSHERSCGGRV